MLLPSPQAFGQNMNPDQGASKPSSIIKNIPKVFLFDGTSFHSRFPSYQLIT